MEKRIGIVEGYFSKIGVAAIKLEGDLKVGDKIKIKGHTTNFEITIESMQINRQNVESATNGDEIGILVPDRVRPGDIVYLID